MRRLIAATLFLVCTGCAGRVPATSVEGKWRADYPFGHQTLMLRSDGTYRQEVTIDQSPANPTTNEGKWRYDETIGVLYYENCLSVTDGFGGLNKHYAVPVTASCAKPVERRFLWIGGLRIGGEEGDLFIRQ